MFMRVGAVLLLVPLPASLLLPAAAQEAEESPAPIVESAVYVSSATGVLPRTVTSDVPPTAACVVVPEACPPELDPIRDPVRNLVGDVASSDVSTPVQPIAPDTVAVSFLGGALRYQSAIRFEAPSAPDGEEITQFDLVLAQGQPTFDMDSPAFRRIVLGVFEAVAPQDPQFIVDGLIDALENEEPLDLSQKVGIEACALLEPFEPSEPPMAQSDEQIPSDESGEPSIDCVLGGLGRFDEQQLTWTFDLRFAARAWATGEIDNHGVLLRPIGVQNLAFGDPDPTTSAQITLDLTSSASALATQPLPPPLAPPVPAEPPTLAGGTGLQPGDPVPLGPPLVTPPAAAPPGPAVEPPTAPPSVASDAVAAGPIEQPWWMWLVLVAFAAGIRLALVGFAGTEAGTAASAAGAMSHLLARRARGNA